MSKDYRFIIDPIKNEKGIYQAKCVDPNGRRSAPFDFTPPHGKKQLDELRWYLEEFIQFPGAGDRVRARKLEKNLIEWGRMLFDAVFPGQEGKQIYRNLTEDARNAQNGGALFTLVSTDVAVLAQPWELMQDTHGILALRGVSIRRQLPDTRNVPHFHFQLPLRILLIVARPKDAGFIDPRNSIPPILDAVESLPDQVQVDFCEPPTLAELERRLRAARQTDQPYHIVHFDGHGGIVKRNDPNRLVTEAVVLYFEKDESERSLIVGKQLGKLLSEHHIPW
uniref:CHAT domain-containing protein n=1 Tax=Candidatus Kentrum sp. MB TaxID=2138164 RepID=A0A450XKE1_9GAMM|nr:MAG: hypothetical protein BECKMB1821G_GA0114241_101113 [Candidatus Kentron sp. MB]VFK29783.1 MAG: hypothetical protein BECKMB1821I_GA0114274_10122 [Candidatus Kentron sp. MB]VFK74944.1 MAG: hypothetical protein BECKMB1821H_GA0114242_10132 [Candidatus Kentron sp. MB]